NFQELATTIRSFVEGRILYTLIDGDEEVDIRLSSQKKNIDDIQNILDLYTSNEQQYLVPIASIVDVEETIKPSNISRVNFKRSTKVYADFVEDPPYTPLEVASMLETNVFPGLIRESPSTNLVFRGEVEDSRQSQGDFSMSIVLALMLIYILLVFLFNSLSVPFLIALIIPFGTVGVIVAFLAHGIVQYGFFAVVGTLGMTGVVINDAIVLLNKLENDIDTKVPILQNFAHVAEVCATRLRPIILTTLTTIAGIFPTAYGIAGYDSMLAEMMLAMGWGLLFGTMITLVLVPCVYVIYMHASQWSKKWVM
ncbi:MAG: efflux RND transporter permease subunit, partial [Bdellovibrionota bacterium]